MWNFNINIQLVLCTPALWHSLQPVKNDRLIPLHLILRLLGARLGMTAVDSSVSLISHRFCSEIHLVVIHKGPQCVELHKFKHRFKHSFTIEFPIIQVVDIFSLTSKI